MSPRRGQAPSWLYSFVDLAFLLLITVSQLDLSVSDSVELGEIRVPRVDAAAARELPPRSGELWQVRVYPPGEAPRHPFELVRAGNTLPERSDLRLDAEELRHQLARLRAARTQKPLLAPHEHSHSRDLLLALAIVEDLWPSQQWATVTPVSAAP